MRLRLFKVILCATLVTVCVQSASAVFTNLGNYTLVQHSSGLSGSLLDFSGIAYRDDNAKLYVISNGTTAIHRYTTAGVFEGTIALSGFTDTEGLAYLGGDAFAVIEEGVKDITRITITSGMTSGTITKASGVTMNPNIAGTFSNSGFEDVTYNATANKFYVVKEKDTTTGGTVVKGVYQVDNLGGGGSATTTQLSGVTTTLNPLATDLAGIYFNNLAGGNLYVLSDEARNIMQVTTSGTLVNTLKIPLPVPIGTSNDQLEGITFSADGTHLFVIGEPREYLHYQFLNAASTAATSGTNNLNSFVTGNKRTFLSVDVTNGSYAGLTSYTTAGGTVIGTTATIVQGKNASGAAETVSMNWRDRATVEKRPSPSASLVGINAGLISDVVELTGMAVGAGTVSGQRKQADPFALQISYNPSLLIDDEAVLAGAGKIFLAWLDTDFDTVVGASANDRWKLATAGNFGVGSTVLTNQPLSWTAFATANSITDSNIGNFLGSWGVDIAGNNVWAVVNHNSQFAAIPEPASLVLAGTAGLGLMAFGRRRRRQA